MTDRRPWFAADGAWRPCCGRLAFVTLITVAMTGPLRGQAPAGDALRTRVRAYRTAHDTSIVRELRDFVAIPNVASDTANIRRNAERLRTMMESRGIAAKILDSPTGGSPAVYGELSTPGATRTVVFYAHYDGQPVDPAQWTSPPWSPVLLDKALDAGGKPVATPAAAGAMQGEWRLYGRSSSDDKAPIVAMLTAVDALKSAGVRPSVNLKLFFEGEEEAGLRTPRVHPREERRPSSRRRLALRRWTGAPIAAAAGRVRRARRDRSARSRSTARRTRCTAATTGTGRRIR